MRAPPRADSSFFFSAYGVLAAVSSCCSSPKGRSYALLTRPPLEIPLPEEKGGSAERGLYHERSKEVNLFQIYNMDSGNAMELGFHADPNESSFPRRISQFYFLMGAGKGYNSAVECHLDMVEVISEYEAHGYKLCLGMKDNSEPALPMNKEAISNATMNLMESSILAQDERWRHA
ncbi:hypothetical protein PVK06_008518 [Gossypium arboreum]|uniref:Uncharacterized protein n=1 Tax=Gossypium arboreum TaxID=29729 RepID=A0ABR0QKW3_GOSAR|nr:hypothetical protein PVK06_008518 [Gossypium arboreum]